MERSNPPPKTECCRKPGQVPEATEAAGPNELLEAYTGKLTGRRQDSHPAQAIEPRNATKTQAGTQFAMSEPKTSQSGKGEGQLGLPGSESVAREQRTARNLGDPTGARRTNHESQAGRPTQPQEAAVQSQRGVRLTHSRAEPARHAEEASGQGVNGTAQPAQETGAVRTTEDHWQSTLQALARKAQEQKRYRFGDLYRLLNEPNLRGCFYQLRQGAAPGVEGVSFQEYEQNLEANLRELVERLRRGGYHARLIRRKYNAGPQIPGLLELLWSQGQFPEPGAILSGDAADTAQVAEPTQPEEELHSAQL